MNKKHYKTLEAIFKKPVQANVKWNDIEALFLHIGALISEGRGSRVRVLLDEQEAVFYRPHPQKEADKGALASVKKFLERAGVQP